MYREEVYLEKLRQLSLELKTLAICRAQSEALDARGVPDGSVIFNRPKKRHRLQSGEERIYQYTCTYLYIGRKRYCVHRRYAYPEYPPWDADVNNPEEAAWRPILQARLELRMALKAGYRQHRRLAELYCSSLNGMKALGTKAVQLEEALEEAYEALCASGEYTQIQAELDRRLGIEYGVIADNRREEQRQRYYNEIYNEHGERLRSKNEVIAAHCARDCGLSYRTEPFYCAASDCRADLAVRAGGQEVLVEICGKRTNPQYEAGLQEKIRLARAEGLPLVVIDMTDYPDGKGTPYTRIHMGRLRRLFQQIQLGTLRSGIVTPY